MFQIRDMIAEDRKQVLAFVKEFYSSDAVEHAVPLKCLEKSFDAAISADPILRGVVLMENEVIIGYAYLTFYFACEVGGFNVLLEEVFISDGYQNLGYGKKFFQWIFDSYPDAARFRLEVTKENGRAVSLYERLGFRILSYDQMVLDRDTSI